MLIPLLLTLAAAPRPPTIQGLDKPKKEQRANLANSETTKGKVTIHCRDVGPVMLVEVIDPGLMGAHEVWLQKKSGEAMPACTADDAKGTHVTGAEGFGYVAGTQGDLLFVTSADAFGDKVGLRVFSLTTGEQLFETEFSTQQPVTVTVEGKSTWLRYHQSVVVTCELHGDEAERCWESIKEAAQLPAEVEVKAPSCGTAFKGKDHFSTAALVALPAEVDLAAPKTVKFRPGQATCAASP